MYFLCLAVQKIDWCDALTQFKNDRLWGDYPTSKVFQILSAYKLKQNLLGSRIISSFFCEFTFCVFS
jgi:hypothetical protein